MQCFKLHYVLFQLICIICISNSYSQNESIDKKWDVAVNGIRFSESTSLLVRESRFFSFESTLIEVPILLKTNINEKLSVLLGTKFDFYRNDFGFSRDVGVSTTFGFQYDVNPNTYIQGLLNYRIKSVNNVYHYNYESKLSVMLNAGFKF